MRPRDLLLSRGTLVNPEKMAPADRLGMRGTMRVDADVPHERAAVRSGRTRPVKPHRRSSEWSPRPAVIASGQWHLKATGRMPDASPWKYFKMRNKLARPCLAQGRSSRREP